MDEKRKFERLSLDVNVEIERIDSGDTTTIKYLTVNVTDISRNGIGFTTKNELQNGTVMQANITIWTKEVLHTIFKVVRAECIDGLWHYGCIFVGMREEDALKIQIYQMIQDRDINENQKV